MSFDFIIVAFEEQFFKTNGGDNHCYTFFGSIFSQCGVKKNTLNFCLLETLNNRDWLCIINRLSFCNKKNQPICGPLDLNPTTQALPHCYTQCTSRLSFASPASPPALEMPPAPMIHIHVPPCPSFPPTDMTVNSSSTTPPHPPLLPHPFFPVSSGPTTPTTLSPHTNPNSTFTFFITLLASNTPYSMPTT